MESLVQVVNLRYFELSIAQILEGELRYREVIKPFHLGIALRGQRPSLERLYARQRLALASASTRSDRNALRGRPSFFPLALAFCTPAFTRSAVRDRSDSAIAPIT